MVRFISLSSGSSGNCYYLGTEQYGILLDAGIPFRIIKDRLKANGLDPDKIRIRALLITHDHTDHIKAASMVSYAWGCPVYSTKEVHQGMDRNYGLQKKIPLENRRYVPREVSFQLGATDFQVTAFAVPHDSTDNVGYYIELAEGNQTMRFGLVTDCGYVTPEIRHYLSRADHIVLESNHDEEMLLNGPYPQYLKKRVLGQGGHLSNKACAELIHDFYHKGTKHLFLCHLSAENNTPDIAYTTASNALRSMGVRVGEDIVLSVLARNTASLVYNFSESPRPQQLEIPFDEH